MKRIITAKFKSKCQETGKTINKGDTILYDPSLKVAYCQSSEEYKSHNNAEFIQDPGEQFFDNWCQNNGI